MLSEQLNIMHFIYIYFEKSFIVSVLPVAGGPVGATPKWNYNAKVTVKKQFSYKGVMTNLFWVPKKMKKNEK